MRHPVPRHLWRRSFIWALRQLGEAAARLPVGVPDPVLCGTSAVELYTGGLWVAPRLVVQSQAARVLTAEWFAAGFRVQRHHHDVGSNLWHSSINVGMDLVERCMEAGSTETTNTIRVAVDEPNDHAEPVSIKVIALEDLIVKEAVKCLTYGRLSSETVERIRVLVELGSAGVGGGFRASYLERRLGWETAGEIVLDSHLIGASNEYAAAARTITLGEMRHVISTWRTGEDSRSTTPYRGPHVGWEAPSRLVITPACRVG